MSQRASLPGLIALALGGGILAVTVMLAFTGLLRSAVYDRGAPGPGELAQVEHPNLVIHLNDVIDRNVKRIRDATRDEPGAYNGYLSAIDQKENRISGVARATDLLLANVQGLSDGLESVSATNGRVHARLRNLARRQAVAAATLKRLGRVSAGVVGTLSSLAAATESVSGSVARIAGLAGAIAQEKLPAAVAGTEELDRLLPPRVPPPRYEPVRR